MQKGHLAYRIESYFTTSNVFIDRFLDRFRNINHNYTSVKWIININVELNNIKELVSTLNFKKVKFMIFHYRQRNIDNLIPDLQINSETIERLYENVPRNLNFLELNRISP